MLDYADLIARLEKVPVSEVNRSIAQAEFIAAKANSHRISRALTWISGAVRKSGRLRAVRAFTFKLNSFLTA